MFLIPRKRIWTQQPQYPAQIDFGNPITKGLAFVDNAATFANAKSVSRNGFCHTAGSAAASTGQSLPYGYDALNGLTMLSVGFLNGTANSANRQYGARFGSSNTVRFGVGLEAYSGNGAIYGAVGYVDYSQTSLPVTPHSVSVNGGSLTLGLTYRRGSVGGLRGFVNGRLNASADTADKALNAGGANLLVHTADAGTNNSGYLTTLNLFFKRTLSDEEIASLSENPWQIFHSPDSRVFVPTGAGAAVGAVLTGNAQAQATATGNLTLKADLDAVALSVATASGNLTTFIPLTGAAVAIGSASGALTSGIKLSAAATASALASGSLVAQIKLNGAALAQAAASAGLTSAILLAGSGQGQATASGTLAAAPGSMAANAQAQASAVATLTTSIKLSGAAAAQAGVSGILTTNISMTAAALAQAIATGTLAVPILLAGAAHGVATATGNLTAPDSATAVYFRLASSVQRLTKAACTAQRLTTIKHEVQHV